MFWKFIKCYNIFFYTLNALLVTGLELRIDKTVIARKAQQSIKTMNEYEIQNFCNASSSLSKTGNHA